MIRAIRSAGVQVSVPISPDVRSGASKLGANGPSFNGRAAQRVSEWEHAFGLKEATMPTKEAKATMPTMAFLMEFSMSRKSS